MTDGRPRKLGFLVTQEHQGAPYSVHYRITRGSDGMLLANGHRLTERVTPTAVFIPVHFVAGRQDSFRVEVHAKQGASSVEAHSLMVLEYRESERSVAMVRTKAMVLLGTLDGHKVRFDARGPIRLEPDEHEWLRDKTELEVEMKAVRGRVSPGDVEALRLGLRQGTQRGHRGWAEVDRTGSVRRVWGAGWVYGWETRTRLDSVVLATRGKPTMLYGVAISDWVPFEFQLH